jgi:hypothetical protein
VSIIDAVLGKSAWTPRDRFAGRGRTAAATLAAALSGLLATAATAPASPPAGEAAKSGGKLRALVVREAHSPVIRSLKRLGQPIRFKRSSQVPRRSWSRHDLLVVDGDELSARKMKRRKELRSFSRSHQWVLGLDLGTRHHASAIAPQTDFEVPQEGDGQQSEVFLYRRALEGTTPQVQMIDYPKLKPRRAHLVGKRKRARLQRKQADKAARLVRTHAAAASAGGAAAAAAPTENGCQPGSALAAEDPAPPELQHVHWTYCNQGQQPAEDGYWTAGRSSPSWLDSKPAPGHQTYSWTFLHNFDLYLDNANRPQGNFQVVTYDFDGQFTPKQPQEQFFQLDNVFHIGLGSGDPYHLERGWITGSWEVDLNPDAATNDKLISLDKEPKNENKETEYTSGQDFQVGVSKEGPSIEYGVHTEQSHSIPDWGVRGRGAGNHLNWFFNARHPCELQNALDEGCYGDTFGTPSRPNELSLGELAVHASARWQTRRLLGPNDGTLSFGGFGKVQTWDLACIDWFIACVETRNNNYRNLYDQPRPSFDASVVNPIPIESLTMKPNPANGTKHEVVTGTVTLERKAGIETTVVVSSNTDNALIAKSGGEKGIAGPPGSSGNSVDITIPKGADSQDFKILTNDNRLSPGQHTTAGITAFYTEPTTGTLQINATSGG